MNIIKKVFPVTLSLAVIFSFGQTALAENEFDSPLFAPERSPQVELVSEEGISFSIGEPRIASEPLRMFSNFGIGKSLTYEQKNEDNSIEQLITINHSVTDTLVEIPFEFSNGEYLEIYEEKALDLNQKEDKNSIEGNIYNSQGASIGIFSAELLGKQEELEANTDKSKLNLSINGNNSSNPIQIRLSASTTYYKDYFTKFEWINRADGISLSLTHTDIWSKPGALYARQEDGWSKLKAVHSSSSNWSNESGMYNQYVCHVNFARFKNPWNLEPWRPDPGYALTVAPWACNPQ